MKTYEKTIEPLYNLYLLIPLDFECKDTTVFAHSNSFSSFIPKKCTFLDLYQTQIETNMNNPSHSFG